MKNLLTVLLTMLCTLATHATVGVCTLPSGAPVGVELSAEVAN